MREGWGGKQSSAYSPSSSSSSERSDDDDKYFCVRFIRGWMLGVHLFSRLLGLLLSSYCFRVSTTIFLSSPASTCTTSISVAQATQQLDTYFRPGTATAHTSFQNISSCGWGASLLFKPTSEFKLCTRHTHTHIRTYLKSPFRQSKKFALLFSSLIVLWRPFQMQTLSLNDTTADIHVCCVLCVCTLCQNKSQVSQLAHSFGMQKRAAAAVAKSASERERERPDKVVANGRQPHAAWAGPAANSNVQK